jgi:ribosomal protein S18 acetylase RimI-like enzyme
MLSEGQDNVMRASVRIRERTAEDLPRCAAVLRAVHEDSRYPVVWPDDVERWLTPRTMVQAWVATRDGAVVGHVALGVLSQADGARFGSIERLFVDPACGRAGIGRRLLAHGLTDAGLRGLPVELDVADGSVAAISLYERLGWRLVRRAPISWGGDHASSVLTFHPPGQA